MPKNHHTPTQSQSSRLTHDASFVLLLLFLILGLAACGDRTSLTPGATADPLLEKPRGETVFMRYCNVCHPGGGLGSGPSLKMLTSSKDDVIDIVRHGKGRMPGFGTGTITDEELGDLVDYVLALR